MELTPAEKRAAQWLTRTQFRQLWKDLELPEDGVLVPGAICDQVFDAFYRHFGDGRLDRAGGSSGAPDSAEEEPKIDGMKILMPLALLLSTDADAAEALLFTTTGVQLGG